MKYIIMVLCVIIVIQSIAIGRSSINLAKSTLLLNKSTFIILDQIRQIEEMHSINRVQESWLRDCGFYGKEP